jgi:ABC-2 type transport system permease protein
MNGDLGQARDLYLVAFLNLSVCALALSTLTTRFVFPQFSLEGRRLWILAMSPLRLPSIVLQKFVTSTLCSGLVVIVILFIGGYNLRLGFADSAFFAGAVALLAIGLNGLAVGLGVLFPNLRESNAAKIVSGFGGTLCLVGSFLYILAFILLLAWLRWDVFRENAVDPGWYRDPGKQWGIAAIFALTSAVTLAPLFFSQKKLKRLEILTNS